MSKNCSSSIVTIRRSLCSRVASHLQRKAEGGSKFRIFDCQAVHLPVYNSPQAKNIGRWIGWQPCCTRLLSSWISQGAAWVQVVSSLDRSTRPSEAKALLRHKQSGRSLLLKVFKVYNVQISNLCLIQTRWRRLREFWHLPFVSDFPDPQLGTEY